MNNLKTKVVSFRMNKSDLDMITKAANKLNLNKSAVLRLAISDELSGHRRVKLSENDKANLLHDRNQAIIRMEKLLTSVDALNRYSKVSSDNINQIAKGVNSGHVDSLTGLLRRNLKRDANELIKENDELEKEMDKIWECLISHTRIMANQH